YDLPVAERLEILDRGGENDDEVRLDFSVRFTRDLVGQLPQGRKQDQLNGGKPPGGKFQASQMAANGGDLKKAGIDWDSPPKGVKGSPKASDYDVQVTTDRPGDTVVAGQPMILKVSVTNKGTSPVYELRAITKSDSAYYDEKELVFGRIDPGK